MRRMLLGQHRAGIQPCIEINKKYAQQLENKLKVFKAKTRTKKTCFITVISTYGLKNKDKYPGLVQSELTLDYLFA